jgi:hypothetical protein
MIWRDFHYDVVLLSSSATAVGLPNDNQRLLLVAGKMVLCDRGAIARVAKSEAVAIAGGSAMILANVGPGSLNADLHSVPSVHVDSASGDTIRTYTTTDPSPTAYLTPRVSGTDASAPQVAAFSSFRRSRVDVISTSSVVPSCPVRTSPVWRLS